MAIITFPGVKNPKTEDTTAGLEALGSNIGNIQSNLSQDDLDKAQKAMDESGIKVGKDVVEKPIYCKNEKYEFLISGDILLFRELPLLDEKPGDYIHYKSKQFDRNKLGVLPEEVETFLTLQEMKGY